MDSPIVTVTALDPRFCKLSFLSDGEQHEEQWALVEKNGVCDDFIDAEVSQVIEPPAKMQKIYYIVCYVMNMRRVRQE